MLMTLIQKEILHHILSVRFVALLLMCLLLVPLTLSINHRNYRQSLIDYQEAVKLANIEETTVNLKMPLEPDLEVSKLILRPTPLERFRKRISRCPAKLPWHNPKWHYTGSTRVGLSIPFLSLRTPRLPIYRRNGFQSACVAVYVRCCCRRKRGGHSSDYLSKFPAARRFPLEQVDWRIPCVRRSVFDFASIRFTCACLARIPPRGTRYFSASVHANSCFTPLYCGVFCDRDSHFHTLR